MKTRQVYSPVIRRITYELTITDWAATKIKKQFANIQVSQLKYPRGRINSFRVVAADNCLVLEYSPDGSTAPLARALIERRGEINYLELDLQLDAASSSDFACFQELYNEFMPNSGYVPVFFQARVKRLEIEARIDCPQSILLLRGISNSDGNPAIRFLSTSNDESILPRVHSAAIILSASSEQRRTRANMGTLVRQDVCVTLLDTYLVGEDLPSLENPFQALHLISVKKLKKQGSEKWWKQFFDDVVMNGHEVAFKRIPKRYSELAEERLRHARAPGWCPTKIWEGWMDANLKVQPYACAATGTSFTSIFQHRFRRSSKPVDGSVGGKS